MSSRRTPAPAPAIAIVIALGSAACPNAREAGGVGAAPASSVAPAVRPPKSVVPRPAALPTTSEDRFVPLLPGEPLPADPAPLEGETSGIELVVELRPRALPPIPVHLGANATAIHATNAANVGTIRITIGGGRLRARIGARGFALDPGWEFRADHRRAGAILVTRGANGSNYRVVPVGAIRALFAERRLDVVPLGTADVVAGAPGSHLGRPTTRTTVTTAYGTLVLDQIVAPPSRTIAARGDARSVEVTEPEGGGEPLCRAVLELVAADRAALGSRCGEGLVPVRADIAWASGGGLLLEVTSLREGNVARAELGFPPAQVPWARGPLGELRAEVVAAETSLGLRPRGEPVSLDVGNRTPSPRILVVDAAPIALVPPGGERSIPLRAGRYLVEWRTALGEVVERATEIEVPGRAVATQWVPAPPSSASPIASARNGP
jgi:hypothetical protein